MNEMERNKMYRPSRASLDAANRALDAIRNVSYKAILTPHDIAYQQAAIKKRHRREAKKAKNAEKTRHTTEKRLVVEP